MKKKGSYLRTNLHGYRPDDKNVNTIGEKMDTSIEKQNLPHSKLEKEEDILEKLCLCKQNGIEMKIEKICHFLQIEKRSLMIQWALEVTNLTEYRDREVSRLSGGQHQRVWIAMALCQGTKTLFLDEPTTYLDIRYQIEILQLVKKLNQEFGITIIMVLHDINQAIAYSDNVIGMKDGKVLVEGDPEEVITEESIRELYGIELGVTRVDGRKFVLAV